MERTADEWHSMHSIYRNHYTQIQMFHLAGRLDALLSKENEFPLIEIQ